MARKGSFAGRAAGLGLAAFLCIFLSGCLDDRQAGTEVGNPEITVLARVKLLDGDDSLHMDDFNLKVMEAHYATVDGDTGMIWRFDTGMMVDMAESRSAQNLPMQKLEDRPWSRCDLTLALPDGPDTLADSLNYSEVGDHVNWVRWREDKADKVDRFSLYLPKDYRFHLTFGQETMKPWHQGDTLFVTIGFNIRAFSQALSPDARTLRTGRDGIEYCVLSPTENQTAYQVLVNSMPACFKADAWSAE